MFIFVRLNGFTLLCHTENIDDPCILDLAFILDASGSIEIAWPDVRRFVAGVVKLVNVSSAGTHVGVIKFGSNSDIVFGFNEGQDSDAVVRRVLSLSGPIRFDNTQIHLGLQDANDKLFSTTYQDNVYGYRPEEEVRKVRQIRCYDSPSNRASLGVHPGSASSVLTVPKLVWSGISLVWTQSGLYPILPGPNLV